MTSKPIVYGIDSSPAVKAVLLTLKALNVEYEFCTIHPGRGDNLNPEYLKKNPAHTIPTLEHDGKFIGDSHAINAYLVGAFGKLDDSLYPKDLFQRAVVDQRMHFENSALFYSLIHQVLAPIFARKVTSVPDEKLKAMDAAFVMVERFFGENSFVAGPHMTIADLSFLPSISSICFLKQIDVMKFPKLSAWLERMRSLPYYSEVMETESSFAVAKFLNKQLSKL